MATLFLQYCTVQYIIQEDSLEVQQSSASLTGNQRRQSLGGLANFLGRFAQAFVALVGGQVKGAVLGVENGRHHHFAAGANVLVNGSKGKAFEAVAAALFQPAGECSSVALVERGVLDTGGKGLELANVERRRVDLWRSVAR